MVMAVLFLLWLMLGVGLGLSSISPWLAEGVNAATFGMSAILWLIVTQLIASVMGGLSGGALAHQMDRSAHR
jgi:hypothetical protein